MGGAPLAGIIAAKKATTGWMRGLHAPGHCADRRLACGNLGKALRVDQDVAIEGADLCVSLVPAEGSAHFAFCCSGTAAGADLLGPGWRPGPRRISPLSGGLVAGCQVDGHLASDLRSGTTRRRAGS